MESTPPPPRRPTRIACAFGYLSLGPTPSGGRYLPDDGDASAEQIDGPPSLGRPSPLAEPAASTAATAPRPVVVTVRRRVRIDTVSS